MVRKQSLANKQRSQKTRNKKRARTIRSMRQVNGGGWFSRAKVVPASDQSSVLQPLLSDQSSVSQPLLSDQSSVLQPLLASSSVPSPSVPSPSVPSPSVHSPSVTDDEDFDNISEQEYDNIHFNICLNNIVSLCAVDPHLCVVDRTLKEYNETNSRDSKKKFKKIIHKKVIDTIQNFTSEDATTLFKTTFDTFNNFFEKLENENLKNKMKSEFKKKYRTKMYRTTDLIRNLNMLWSELILFAKKIIVMNMTEMNMTEMNMKMTDEYLIFVATYTFNKIFNNFETHFTEDTLTAGGSKGNMKSKMSRRKSRTRKS